MSAKSTMSSELEIDTQISTIINPNSLHKRKKKQKVDQDSTNSSRAKIYATHPLVIDTIIDNDDVYRTATDNFMWKEKQKNDEENEPDDTENDQTKTDGSTPVATPLPTNKRTASLSQSSDESP